MSTFSSALPNRVYFPDRLSTESPTVMTRDAMRPFDLFTEQVSGRALVMMELATQHHELAIPHVAHDACDTWRIRVLCTATTGHDTHAVCTNHQWLRNAHDDATASACRPSFVRTATGHTMEHGAGTGELRNAAVWTWHWSTNECHEWQLWCWISVQCTGTLHARHAAAVACVCVFAGACVHACV